MKIRRVLFVSLMPIKVIRYITNKATAITKAVSNAYHAILGIFRGRSFLKPYWGAILFSTGFVMEVFFILS